MNIYGVIIVAALVLRVVLDVVADALNLRHLSPELPEEFESVYDADTYRKSQEYLRDNVRSGLVQEAFFLVVTLAFMFSGGFNWLDGIARSAGWPATATGVLFGGMLFVGSQALGLPFSAYDTFVIEEKYGFNRTTLRTFVLDFVKTLVLGMLLGSPLFAAVVWLFQTVGPQAWVICWIVVSVFQIIIVFIAPTLIMPLFNKFTPLEEGPLRESIEDYARRQQFALQGIYTMDGSKRSSKSNAFFTGFGRSRRIALFDTLIERHTVPELVSVLAHEIGHYKQHHILKGMIRGIILTGVTVFLVSFFIGNERLFAAFHMQHVSVYAGLIFFGFLYLPLSTVIGILEHAVSRRQEYQADRFAAETAGAPNAMISALKKLSKDNLSNLTPHPFKVVLDYSHPPVIERIRALKTQP